MLMLILTRLQRPAYQLDKSANVPLAPGLPAQKLS
jgi:hypothetical protein